MTLKFISFLFLLFLFGCNRLAPEKIFLTCEGKEVTKNLVSQFPTVYENTDGNRKISLKIEVMRREDLYKKTNSIDPITTEESKNSKAYVATFTGNTELYTKFSEFQTDKGYVTINHTVEGNEQTFKIYKSETIYDGDDKKNAKKKIVIYSFYLDRISGDYVEKQEIFINYSVLPSTVESNGTCKKIDKVI